MIIVTWVKYTTSDLGRVIALQNFQAGLSELELSNTNCVTASGSSVDDSIFLKKMLDKKDFIDDWSKFI